PCPLPRRFLAAIGGDAPSRPHDRWKPRRDPMSKSSRWVTALLSILVIACDESPTDTSPPQQIRLLRFWRHNTYRLATGYVEGPWDYRMNGVLYDRVEYGPMVLYPAGRDSIAR